MPAPHMDAALAAFCLLPLLTLCCLFCFLLLPQFANAFRILFQQSTSHSDPVVLAMASKALGHLARAGGALTVEFVEFQIKQSLEWLQVERNERRHLAAVLVLRELAQNTPTLFNVYVDDFLEHIWVALRDPKEEIREASVEALRVCLRDIAKRGRDWRVACYGKLFAESVNGFQAKKQSVHTIHGSLLCVGELLDIQPPEFLKDKSKATCEYVLQYREHSNALIVRTVISLIPRLAALSPADFSRNYLSMCLDYLINYFEQMKVTQATRGQLAQSLLTGCAVLHGPPPCTCPHFACWAVLSFVLLGREPRHRVPCFRRACDGCG